MQRRQGREECKVKRETAYTTEVTTEIVKAFLHVVGADANNRA